MRSSAVVNLLPQGWDAFLLTMTVKSAYLSYQNLPVSLNQSGHSSLSSLIIFYFLFFKKGKKKKTFPPAGMLLTGCGSLFFAPFCITSRLYCAWKWKENGQVLKYSLKAAHLALTTTPQSKLLSPHFSNVWPPLDLYLALLHTILCIFTYGGVLASTKVKKESTLNHLLL